MSGGEKAAIDVENASEEAIAVVAFRPPPALVRDYRDVIAYLRPSLL
jgi:hypothetical protein